MNRKHYRVRLSSLKEQGQERDLVEKTHAERLEMVWPLTVTAWAFRGESIAQLRLQRHIVRLRRLN